jgi:hypothetical protein
MIADQIYMQIGFEDIFTLKLKTQQRTQQVCVCRVPST